MALHRLPDGAVPAVVVVARLAHVHRDACAFGDLGVTPHGTVIVDGVAERIVVAGEHLVLAEREVVEGREVGVPLRAGEHDHVVGVRFANGVGRAALHGGEKSVKLLLVGEVAGDGLVHEVVAEDGGVVGVARGDGAPDFAVLALEPLAPEEPRVAVAVVDVRAGLPAGAVMHVEDDLEPVGAAPADGGVQAAEALRGVVGAEVVLGGEELVVEGEADGVRAGRGDEGDVGLGDVVVLEGRPEVRRLLGADELAEHLVDEVRGVALAEAEHVAFGVEPVAEVRPPDEELPAVSVDEICARCVDECVHFRSFRCQART